MADRKAPLKKPDLSIVVGTVNRPQILLNLLRQIIDYRQNLSVEILVFDQSVSNNQKKSRSDIVVYFDDDVVLTPTTLHAHYFAYSDRNAKAVAGRVINEKEKNSVIISSIPTGRINWYGAEFRKNFSSISASVVDFPYGCNMSFRKEVLKEVNGFDNALKGPIFAYNEIDVGIRINKKYPRSLRFVPEALVYHLQYETGGTRTYKNSEIRLNVLFNYGYFLGKNYTLSQNFVCFLRRLPYQIFREPAALPHIFAGFFSAKKNTTMKYLKNNLPAIAIFIFIVLLRLWRVPQFFSFNFDEEYQATLAWEQVKHFHKIWIGVSASNLNYYLGPGFTYLNAFLFKLSQGDPVILAWFSGIFGIITTLSVLYVGSKIYSKYIGFIASLIYGGSALINYYDRRFWNPTAIPFITVWMFYSLVRGRKDARWLIVSAFLIGAAFHVHLSLMIFWPILLLVIWQKRTEIKQHTRIMMADVYLLVTFPLLIFDIVHKYDNLLAPLRFFQLIREPNHSPQLFIIWNHFLVFFNSLGRIIFLSFGTNIQEEQNLGQHGLMTIPFVLISLFSFLVFLWFLSQKKNSYQNQLLSWTLLLSAASLIVYPGVAGEYYLLSFIVLFPFVLAVFLSKLPKFVTAGLLTLFLVFNAVTVFTTSQTPYGLSTKKRLIQKVMKIVDGKTYVLETYGKDPRKYHPYGGWRYLFKIYGRTPTHSFADEFFGWIYRDELSTRDSRLRVVVSEDIPYQTPLNVIARFHEGAYYAYVIENN
ncbi:glycosyltransferase [Candidatus Roizmanbacteria bacterium]|nr:glycosyltransferase [Candidatus Roizmanbacteria bacterium]